MAKFLLLLHLFGSYKQQKPRQNKMPKEDMIWRREGGSDCKLKKGKTKQKNKSSQVDLSVCERR